MDFDDFEDFERWDYFYGDDEPPRRSQPVGRNSQPDRLTDDEIKRLARRGDSYGRFGGAMVIVMVVILILGLFCFLIS